MGIQQRILAAVIALPWAALWLIGSLTSVAAQDIARMKSEYRRPPTLPVANQALVALGRELFFDPQISASGKTACASCHFPELGWTVKDARSINDSGKPTSRKSPSLIGLGYAGKGPFGWDGRNASLETQVTSSIATGSMSMRETDTPVKVEVIEERIRSAPAYAAKFQAALPDKPMAAWRASWGQSPPARSAMASRGSQMSAARSLRMSGIWGAASAMAWALPKPATRWMPQFGQPQRGTWSRKKKGGKRLVKMIGNIPSLAWLDGMVAELLIVRS